MSSSTAVDSPIPPADRPSLLRPLLAVAAVLIFFGFPGTGGEWLDLRVQAWFWDGRDWLIPKDAGWPHTLAYTGPKVLLYLFALGLLWAIARPSRAPVWLGRRRAAYLFLCLAVVSVACTQLREVTFMATPRQLTMYGANPGVPHLLLFDAKPPGYPSDAFPAGHASGGFALLALAFAWSSAVARRRGVCLALLVGGWMGLYQLARGEHFLSHTLATAALAWLLVAGLARACRPTGVSSTS
jgi:membrane-associated PAP2 superfamily phosphatase